MKRSILIFSITAFAFAACKKTDVVPSAKTPVASNTSTSQKNDTVVTIQLKTSPVAKGGGGNGGGGNGGGGGTPSNLVVFTQQMVGGWASSVASVGSFTIVKLTYTFNSAGTFTLIEAPSTGGQKTVTGTWLVTIPVSLPVNEQGVLTLTSGGKTLLSGYFFFNHPGLFFYTLTTNTITGSLTETLMQRT